MLGLGSKVSKTSYLWTPGNIKAGLKLWYRNNTQIGVAKWNDQSGNLNHAVQSSSGNQAVVSSGGLDFEGGSSHHYDLTSDVVISEGEAFTIFIVCQFESFDSQNSILGTGDNNVFLEFQTNRKIRIKAGGDTDSIEYPSGTFDTGTKALFTIQRQAGETGNINLYKNGVSVSPATQQANTGAITFNQLASRNNDRYFDGIIYELLCYDGSDIVDSEIEKLNKHLIRKLQIET